MCFGVHFLYIQPKYNPPYVSSITQATSVWLCLMLTKHKNVKRDTNAFVMLSYSFLYDELYNALSDGSFISSANNLPVVPDMKD